MASQCHGQAALRPDIVLTYTYSIALEYYEQGGVWDLSEFIDGDDQALNMKAYLGEDVIDYGRLTGGDELCGIIARRATTARSNYFVRKDWMDELNLEAPTTTDELYDFIETNLAKEEWVVKLITCPEEEFESNWESYMAALKDAGVETIEQERREHFTK